MNRASDDDEPALVPAPGEIARLTVRASARAREDAAECGGGDDGVERERAVRVCG